MAARRNNRWIFLIGFSGSGKSSLGPRLAVGLGRRFYDLDDMIEKKTGRSISEIFERKGEPAFRKREYSELKRLVAKQGAGVVALGGGAFESPRVRGLAKQNALTVYLSCSVRELYRRLREVDDRPLLNVSSSQGETPRQARLRRIREMLNKRLANYRRADLIHSTGSRSVAQSIAQLSRMLKDMA